MDEALYLNNVTIAANIANLNGSTAKAGGGLFHQQGRVPIVSTEKDKVLVKNSVMTGNTDQLGMSSDCVGQMASQGYNLIQNATDCTIEGGGRTNIIGQPGGLGPLQNNGGPTLTHAPQPSSLLLDRIPGTSCADVEGSPLTADQRGGLRPIDGDGDHMALCDIGAVER